MMWSRSVLRVAQGVAGVAMATLLVASASACGSPAKSKAAAMATTPTATTTKRILSPTATIPLQLGCGPSVHPASSVIRSGPASHEIALTFDDGPSPDATGTILTTLEQTHTPATFFVVGAHVQQYPALVQREASDGFALGLHTWDHPDMTQLTPDQREWELAATAQAIHTVLGAGYCLPFWRPPYGDYNAAVVAQTYAFGLTTVTWDVDPRDWSLPGVKIIVERVLSAIHPGAIILLHDGPLSRWQTAQALPLIIRGLKRRGYVLVTLPELLSGLSL